MRIIIQNYSNKLSTEPLYITHVLQMAGIETHLWTEGGVYDTFDTFKPTHLVCHYEYVDNSLMEYLNDNPNIKVTMNVTGATEAQTKSIKDVFNNVVMFTNAIKSKSGVETLWPAHDMFNSFKSYGEPNIGVGVCAESFSEKLEEFVSNKDVYHLLYIGKDKEKEVEFDLTVEARNLPQLYPIYKGFHIHGDLNLCTSQVFFDATMNSLPSVDCTDEQGFDNFLTTCMKTPDEYMESDHIVGAMRNTIMQNHTPFHRAARLMKIMGEKEAMSKVETLKSKRGTQ